MSSSREHSLASTSGPTAARCSDSDTQNSKRKSALEGPGLRTRPRLSAGTGPAVLTALQDARSSFRLEVSCLVRMAQASSMMTDVSRLLFDEGADIVEADTVLDGDYVSMFYILQPSACGPRCWQALLSKVNASVSAASRDVAPQQSCTCQVHNVSVEAHSESIGLRTVWDALHDCGLQVLSCSMQAHGSHPKNVGAGQCGSSAFNEPASRDSTEAGVASDMSFLVVDLLQQLSGAERQSAVAESVMNACRGSNGATCSVGITEPSPRASDASDQMHAGHCFCQQRRQSSGFGGMLYPESYLEPCTDGRKQFVLAGADENLEPGAVELYLDDAICKSSTCIEIECRDRKGLLYDALRTADSAGLHVAQARCCLQMSGRASIQLFLRDPLFQPLADDSVLRGLLHQLRNAITQPLSVAVVPSEEGMLDVLVVTPLDSGQRGRPRVARDVAAVLASEPLRINTAFIGAVGDCADQDCVPGDVLHEMMSSLHLPHLQSMQRRSQDPRMLSWVEDANSRLLVYTPRVTDSPLFSPCANEAGKDPGPAHCSRSLEQRATSGPPPAPSCDARSAASEDPWAVPVLHDLEQHFCSAFLDDDFVPREEHAGVSAAQSALPAGFPAKGGAGPDGVRSPCMVGKPGVDGGRRLGKQESNLETGLSFFGPATAHSHFPEELGRMVEVYHFVVEADERKPGSSCCVLPTLRAQLEAKLMGVPSMDGTTMS